MYAANHQKAVVVTNVSRKTSPRPPTGRTTSKTSSCAEM
jgi:hypothetical protein